MSQGFFSILLLLIRRIYFGVYKNGLQTPNMSFVVHHHHGLHKVLLFIVVYTHTPLTTEITSIKESQSRIFND